MPVDPNIDILKALADQIAADDAVEDAAYEATIAQAVADIAALTTERDDLLTERATTIADLITARDLLDARITALGG
jgi:hypothetical protein